jgi:hypothetical protein
MKNKLQELIKECLSEVLWEAEMMNDLKNFALTLTDAKEKKIFNNIISPILYSSVEDPITQRKTIIEFINIIDGKSTPNPISNNLNKKITDHGLGLDIARDRDSIKLVCSKLWQFFTRNEQSKKNVLTK